jgi:SAM-dependent methyltransferase
LALHLNPELWAFLSRWLPTPPARVIDVGCGGGALTRRLRGVGFDAVGLDPEAPSGEGFLRLSLEELTATEEFDAAVAIRSLHHLHEPTTAVDRLTAALRPGAPLVVFEFDVAAVDERARRWLAERDLKPVVATEEIPRLVELETVRGLLLGARLQPLLDEPAPYLAAESDRPDLEPEERDAISRGELPATGARLVYELGT